MNDSFNLLVRRGTLLAINLLFLMVWGMTGLGKLRSGPPAWMGEKFGGTVLATFPGITASFWLLALAEMAAFALALVALVRGEFLVRKEPRWLTAALVWSLFVFVQLGLGQWLTGEFTGAHQLFMYFCGTLVALTWVQREGWPRAAGSERDGRGDPQQPDAPASTHLGPCPAARHPILPLALKACRAG